MAILLEYRVTWLSVSNLKALPAVSSSFVLSWTHARTLSPHVCLDGVFSSGSSQDLTKLVLVLLAMDPDPALLSFFLFRNLLQGSSGPFKYE